MNSEDLERINAILERDSELRDKIRDQVAELDKRARNLVGLLNKIHSTPAESLPALVDTVRPVISSYREPLEALVVLIPRNEFWKWKDMWTNSIRTAVFAATLSQYLTDRTLLSLPDTANLIGVKEEWKDRFILPTEDYLHGLINVVNELSRLAVNSVTLGNFEEPIRISVFVKDLFAGFSMLNLKNDTLRRRFDSLKYDLKKIEEVVYDVALRKLVPVPTAGPSTTV